MSNKSQRFFDLYSSGEALEEEIDDYISNWHKEMKGRIFSLLN